MVESCSFFSLVDFILTSKNGSKKPTRTGLLDYEATKENNSRYYEGLRNLPENLRGKNANLNDPILQQLKGLAPKPEWPLFQAINQMSAIIGYNDMVTRWEDNGSQFGSMLNLVLTMTAVSPNQVEEAQAGWNAGVKQSQFKGKAEATAAQLFNPASGKGQNSAKSSVLSMGNLNNFWLIEFLKCIGAFEAAAPRLIRNLKNPRAKDRKLYVLAPKDIELELNKGIWEDFEAAFKSDTSIRMDIKAALTYTRTFLNRSETNAQVEDELSFLGSEPENYIHGLWSVFYKDMGNSPAVMNLSFIGLPGWINSIQTREEISQYLSLIDEHEALLKNLNEERAEEYDMLLTYRNFLSGRELTALLDFYADYGRFYMGVTEREWDRRGRYLRLPDVAKLEMIMKDDRINLSAIVQDAGFLQVAYAIRHSTVIPQRHKARGDQRLYEPRYGLIQELKRKGQYKDEFVTALTDFVSSYNLETEQIYERKAGFNKPEDISSRRLQRSRVEKKHLDALISLVDANGATLICNLLAAYGSAVDSRSKQEQGAVEAASESQADEMIEAEVDVVE